MIEVYIPISSNNLTHIIENPGQWDMTIQVSNECLEWLKERTPSFYERKWFIKSTGWVPSGTIFEFDDKNEAMLFKLTWS